MKPEFCLIIAPTTLSQDPVKSRIFADRITILNSCNSFEGRNLCNQWQVDAI